MKVINELPKFDRPPVDEVVVGAKFSAPGFMPTHYGMFYAFLRERLSNKFPHIDNMQPVLELSAQDHISPGAPWPRAIFLSDDRRSIIQIQNDRLYFNWRRRPNLPNYPSYSFVSTGFQEIYSEFEIFALNNQFGPVIPSYGDVHYINHFSSQSTGLTEFVPEKIFRNWSGNVGPEWSLPVKDILFNCRYELPDDEGKSCGYLIANMTTTLPTEGDLQNGDKLMAVLQMSASGNLVSTDLAGITKFHDIGHAAIVRAFTAMTTSAMHERWERKK